MKPTDLAKLLDSFFLKYLPGQRNVSSNTIHAYSDAFSKAVAYFRDEKGVPQEKLSLADFTRESVTDFLSYLESDHNCSISTRNQRLAAIKSFFRYVSVEEPSRLLKCQEILAIRNKKAPKPVMNYLTADEMQLLFAQPDTSTAKGRRNLAMLMLMYDAAVRAQELCDAKVCDLRLENPPVIRLHGKGRKVRDVPLSNLCAQALKKYVSENRLDTYEKRDQPLFFNSQGKKLTRSGVAYVLNKYVDETRTNSNGILKAISPHCLRHSKAMHLVEAGVNLIYIRDFLGHESVLTTQTYARANPEAKRHAVDSVADIVPCPDMADWTKDNDLMSFLRSL